MTPTLGTLFGFIFLTLSILLLAGTAALIWKAIRNPFDDGFGELVGAVFAGVLAVLSAVFPLVGFGIVQWNADYLYYHNVSGTIEQTASRQISDGKTMSTRYVFRINGQDYGVDDTRAALAKPGDRVTLNCTKEFVYGSTANGWACNWGGN